MDHAAGDATSFRVQATKIRSRIDVNTMERPPATQLGLNDIGIVEFEATRNLSFDLYYAEPQLVPAVSF